MEVTLIIARSIYFLLNFGHEGTFSPLLGYFMLPDHPRKDSSKHWKQHQGSVSPCDASWFSIRQPLVFLNSTSSWPRTQSKHQVWTHPCDKRWRDRTMPFLIAHLCVYPDPRYHSDFLAWAWSVLTKLRSWGHPPSRPSGMEVWWKGFMVYLITTFPCISFQLEQKELFQKKKSYTSCSAKRSAETWILCTKHQRAAGKLIFERVPLCFHFFMMCLVEK